MLCKKSKFNFVMEVEKMNGILFFLCVVCVCVCVCVCDGRFHINCNGSADAG